MFKRFKSLARLGHLPKYDDDSAKAWLYGPLFVALLVEKLMRDRGHGAEVRRTTVEGVVDTGAVSLFDDSATLPLEKSDIETVLAASDLDWSEIDPSILGTLFERGLDPGKRAQLGAHYTDVRHDGLGTIRCVRTNPGPTGLGSSVDWLYPATPNDPPATVRRYQLWTGIGVAAAGVFLLADWLGDTVSVEASPQRVSVTRSFSW